MVNKLSILAFLLLQLSAFLFGQKCPDGFSPRISNSGRPYCEECGISNERNNLEIVGGKEARAKSWPSIVYLQFAYKTYFQVNGKTVQAESRAMCAGTLITRNTILTAANCFFKIGSTISVWSGRKEFYVKLVLNDFHPTEESLYTAYLGVHNIQKLGPSDGVVKGQIQNIIIHPQYDEKSLLNDIAIIKLTQEVTLNENIQLACLPKKNETLNYSQKSFAVGWGDLRFKGSSPDQLHNVKLILYQESVCEKFNRDFNRLTQICAGDLAGGKDTCQGDTGGPLYVRNNIGGKVQHVTIGIVSAGEGCGKKNRAGIYTRIAAYYDWIKGLW